MKTTPNQSPKASIAIVKRAKAAGIDAQIIVKSRGHYRRYHPNGSTSVPQKVVLLDGIKMSIGQARQYVAAREFRPCKSKI